MAITELTSWKNLEQHAQLMRLSPFNALKKHGLLETSSKIDYAGIHFDFSQQKINSETLELLLHFAQDMHLKDKIAALFRGDKLNVSEHRPALHTALRHFDTQSIWVDGQDIMPSVIATREQMRVISEQIRTGIWRGYSGLPIRDVVNIGIGGSDLWSSFLCSGIKKISCTSYNDAFYIRCRSPCFF